MTAHLSIQVDGQEDQWLRISKEVDQFGEQQCWSEEVAFTIRLILEELVVNAINYGTDDQSTKVQLELFSDKSQIKIELSDNGCPYNPLEEAPSPDFTSPVKDRPIGGLGVYLVKQLSDKITYRYQDGHNIFTITKRRTVK